MKKALKKLVVLGFVPSTMIVLSALQTVPKEKRHKGFFGLLRDLWNMPDICVFPPEEKKETVDEISSVLNREMSEKDVGKLPDIDKECGNINNGHNAANELIKENRPCLHTATHDYILKDLQKLTELKATGVLSEEEFQAAKQRLLASETHTGNAQEEVIVSGAVEKINDTQGEVKHPWYFSIWFIILTIFMCFPVGIILMWHGKRFPMWVRVILTCFILIYLISLLG